ncbi:MAG: response regulator [Pirellulales bacterium]
MVANPIKVLLIENNRVEALLVKQWLSGKAEPAFELETVDRLAAGLDRLARGGIDIVLSDLNLPDSRGLETFATIHRGAPQVPVVLLTSQNDEALAIKAVEGGAQDYLIKNRVNGNAVNRIIRYALARHKGQAARLNQVQRNKTARIIGFLSGKGGTGTTTVAVNVGAALAKQQKVVVCAELRPAIGTLAFQLRQKPAADLQSVWALPAEGIDERALNALVCKGPGELRLLFGPQEVEDFKPIEPAQAEAVIRGLAGTADYLLLDLPCQPSAATQAAVRLCNFIALVTDREPSSVLACRTMLELMKGWGVGGSLVGAVIVNRTASVAPMKMPDLQAQLGSMVVGVIPPAADACLRAQESGSPLVLSQPNNVASASFVELANRLVADVVVAVKF